MATFKETQKGIRTCMGCHARYSSFLFLLGHDSSVVVDVIEVDEDAGDINKDGVAEVAVIKPQASSQAANTVSSCILLDDRLVDWTRCC
eukprot:m.257708 g.257708  ORF g.257708 m.257708 type:complete len:89 (-) comp15533_c0_seq4:1329-1595(-)